MKLSGADFGAILQKGEKRTDVFFEGKDKLSVEGSDMILLCLMLAEYTAA